MNIDAVYTWTDGNPAWLADREKVLAAGNIGQPPCAGSEELEMSVALLKKNLPWINRIYIVTHGNPPPVHDPGIPGTVLVHHHEIAPEGMALPSYSALAIKSICHMIKGLSERFLLISDDMFILKPLEPFYFYTGQGFPIHRYCNKFKATVDNLQDQSMLNSREAFFASTGDELFEHDHLVRAVTRLAWHRAEVDFQSEFRHLRERQAFDATCINPMELTMNLGIRERGYYKTLSDAGRLFVPDAREIDDRTLLNREMVCINNMRIEDWTRVKPMLERFL